MITCSICKTENHHLAVTCAGCGAFLQQRVETLDLFQTLGHLIESPRKTFHTIGLSRHKNYAVVLAMAAGWPLVFFMFWTLKAGEHAPTFLHLLLAGLATGPFFGLASLLILALLMAIGTRLLRRRVSFRNSFALLAYACMPYLFVLVFLLPVVFLSFGIYFFTSNPSPAILRPFSYYAIASLFGVFALWGIILLIVGMKQLSGGGWRFSLLVPAVTVAVYGALLYGLARWVGP